MCWKSSSSGWDRSICGQQKCGLSVPHDFKRPHLDQAYMAAIQIIAFENNQKAGIGEGNNLSVYEWWLVATSLPYGITNTLFS